MDGGPFSSVGGIQIRRRKREAYLIQSEAFEQKLLTQSLNRGGGETVI